jgi:hypothetical protein
MQIAVISRAPLVHRNPVVESYMKAWSSLSIRSVNTQILYPLSCFPVHVHSHVRKQPVRSARWMERRKRSVHLGYQRAPAVHLRRPPLPHHILSASWRNHIQVRVVEPYDFELQGDWTPQRDVFPRRNGWGAHRP